MNQPDEMRESAAGRGWRWPTLVLIALLLTAAPGCGREPTAPKLPPQSLEEARRLVAEGNEHYGRWVQPESVGDDSELHAAIDCLETALRFLTEDEHPDDWAHAHYLLAQCYEAGRDLEQAVDHCQDALLVYREESHPKEWAHTEYLLGQCYFDGCYPSEQHQRALPHYEAALRVFREDTDAYSWADANYLLGRCHHRSRRLEQAIEHYRAALRVFQEDSQRGPSSWSDATYWLALCHLEHGDAEQAIAEFEDLLRALPRPYYELRRAEAKLGLSRAYGERGVREKSDADLARAQELAQEAVSYYEDSGDLASSVEALAHFESLRRDRAKLADAGADGP